jgi:hypothetical protein
MDSSNAACRPRHDGGLTETLDQHFGQDAHFPVRSLTGRSYDKHTCCARGICIHDRHERARCEMLGDEALGKYGDTEPGHGSGNQC